MLTYCPVVGKCPHHPVTVIKNKFFLIEPFNDEKEIRERTIANSLKKVFGARNFELVTSENEIPEVGIYCDICRKIASSEYCITDLTPDLFGDKLIIRPNVALELGLAFGMHKPSLIISKKINGERLIPSDIKFIRYIDIPFEDWSLLEQELVDTLKDICIGKVRAIQIPNILQENVLQICNEIRIIIKSLENQEKIYYNCKVIKFNYNIRREIIAIVSNAYFLKNGMKLSIFQVDDDIEIEMGILECWHIQPMENIAQCICYSIEESNLIWKKIEKQIIKQGYCDVGNNRLKPIIPDTFTKDDIRRFKFELSILDNLIK